MSTEKETEIRERPVLITLALSELITDFKRCNKELKYPQESMNKAIALLEVVDYLLTVEEK